MWLTQIFTYIPTVKVSTYLSCKMLFDSPVLCWFSGGFLVAAWWLSDGMALEWHGSWRALLLDGMALGWHGSWLAWLLYGVALCWRGFLVVLVALWLSDFLTVLLFDSLRQCFHSVLTMFLHGSYIVLTLFWHCFDIVRHCFNIVLTLFWLSHSQTLLLSLSLWLCFSDAFWQCSDNV